jgi:hypothetical protein
MMEKEFEVVVPIVRISPKQTALKRGWRRLLAANTSRLLVDEAAPLETVVGCIFRNYQESLLSLFYDCIPFLESTNYTPLLPTGKHTKVVQLRKSKYDHAWKVLQRTPQGKVASALWLLKLTRTSARLALYSSRPPVPQ